MRTVLAFISLFAACSSMVAGAEPASIPERIPLNFSESPGNQAAIYIHRAAKPNGAAVVICPGGGYGGLVMGAEGHGAAKWLNEHGVMGVVLQYDLPRGESEGPLQDAQAAIRYVRSQAKELGIDPRRIGIMGFSAGGHLASTAGTHFDPDGPKEEGVDKSISARPDFMVLIYPVITMGEKTHSGSRQNLLGKNPSPELIERFSNEKQVTDKTPPAFLAHAKDDRVVVPENSRMFHEALQAHGVESEYLELPSGGHGLNSYQGPMWDKWQTESIKWLTAQKFIPASDRESKE